MNTFLNLDDTKAGMISLDKEEINKKIQEASLGSLYYETQLKRATILEKRILNQHIFLSTCDNLRFESAKLKMEKIFKDLRNKQDLSQVIVHIDLDAFFAAVEMRDNPTLTSKPIAIGSMQMISTSNYIARRYGVRAGMAGFIGKKLCPDLQFIHYNIHKYKQASKMFQQILSLYDSKFSSGGLDEAYLNLTPYLNEKRTFLTLEERTFIFTRICQCFCHNASQKVSLTDLPSTSNYESDATISATPQNSAFLTCCCRRTTEYAEMHKNGYEIPGCIMADQKYKNIQNKSQSIKMTFDVTIQDTIKEIRTRIYEAIGITCSAGIAPTPLLAKICTDINKPCGQFILESDRNQIETFIKNTPINKINGIGKVTSALLKSINVNTCGDIWTLRDKIGLLYSDIFCRFILSVFIGGHSEAGSDDDSDDDSECRRRKSIGVERTVARCDARHDSALIYEICAELCRTLAHDLRSRQLTGSLLTVKIKSSNFRVMTRVKRLPRATNDEVLMLNYAWDLIRPELEAAKKAAAIENQRLRIQKSQYFPKFEPYDIKSDVPDSNMTIISLFTKPEPKQSTKPKDPPKREETERPYRQIVENQEDFLYLRLLGVRMLKLVNTKTNEMQANYLKGWMSNNKSLHPEIIVKKDSPKLLVEENSMEEACTLDGPIYHVVSYVDDEDDECQYGFVRRN
ncbi:DNA polymerase kappa-like isoform X2 [Gordionus sp. m RMFG-2023]|uniref:DNA polymerase kappa-like isoform X2 n=1 Tax=Gordionus sp. m RMFG-2023 TaxID=3053472 RepID=UPI0031FC7BB0